VALFDFFMSQYPTCKHNWGDMLATCPKCDAEEKDATIENLRNELDAVYGNISELIDLIRLAHEWGANGIKGYSADKAMTFQDAAASILSNK